MLAERLSVFRRDPVLTAAGLAAILSMFFVPPSLSYLSYIDLRVLCLLFCLMAVVVGLQSCQLFSVLAQKLLTHTNCLRTVLLLLVLFPFFSSMLVTNDVALITFVPFAILVLQTINRTDWIIPVIVLQTIAANLGSMVTPVGNPQNLFLYAHYQLTATDFFRTMLPLTFLAFVGLLVTSLAVPRIPVDVSFATACTILSPRRLGLYLALFLLCLLSVFRLLPYGILSTIVLLAFLLTDPPLLKKVNYRLLLTFVFFFLFSGNLGAMPPVRALLTELLSHSAFLSSLLASQCISNVPAAVLLADFTKDWQGMLLGTNIGGLGTLIASLASLISFQFYTALPDAKPLRYLLIFTAANVLGLLVLVPAALLLF